MGLCKSPDDVQATAFYEVMNERAIIVNRPAISKSEIGWDRV